MLDVLYFALVISSITIAASVGMVALHVVKTLKMIRPTLHVLNETAREVKYAKGTLKYGLLGIMSSLLSSIIKIGGIEKNA